MPRAARVNMRLPCLSNKLSLLGLDHVSAFAYLPPVQAMAPECQLFRIQACPGHWMQWRARQALCCPRRPQPGWMADMSHKFCSKGGE